MNMEWNKTGIATRFLKRGLMQRSWKLRRIRHPFARMLTTLLLALATLASSSCSCGGGSGGGGDAAPAGPDCKSGQIINAKGECEACPAGQIINAKGECEACPAGQIANSDGECKACPAGQIANSDGECKACPAGYMPNTDKSECCITSAQPSANNNCFAMADLECSKQQVLDLTGDSDPICITIDACIGLRARTCQTVYYIGVSLHSYQSIEACIGFNDPISGNPYSISNGLCITDHSCRTHENSRSVAKADGSCISCAAGMLRNLTKSSCIAPVACHGNDSNNPNSQLDGDCISDAACLAMPYHVARDDGLCEACTSGKIPNAARTACDNDSDGDGLTDDGDNCPLIANSRQEDANGNGKGDACDSGNDHDGDGENDSIDNCPTVSNTGQGDTDKDGLGDDCDECPMGATGAAEASGAMADPDSDGCKNSEDIDDDNDGLIEIATAEQLDNIRWNLAGTSYDEDEDDNNNIGSTEGAPTAATEYCDAATGGVYLCGYELAANIDFWGEDGSNNRGSGDDIDRNGDEDGNFNAIEGDFTARFEGNGYSIRGLYIDRSGATSADDTANDAALFITCKGAISKLIIEDTTIRARRRLSALCATLETSGSMKELAIFRSDIRSTEDSYAFSMSVGGLVGLNRGNISNGYATNEFILGFGHGNVHIGHLVGWNHAGTVSNSFANGRLGGAVIDEAGESSLRFVGYVFGKTFDHVRPMGSVGAGDLYPDELVGRQDGTLSSSYGTYEKATLAEDVGGFGEDLPSLGDTFLGTLVGHTPSKEGVTGGTDTDRHSIVIFSNTSIGDPKTTAMPGFFHRVGGSNSEESVTLSYNLETDVTIIASAVEQEDGSAATHVTWNDDSAGDGTQGQISGIASGETFWLALTFQEGTGDSAVTQKIRWKFVRP